MKLLNPIFLISVAYFLSVMTKIFYFFANILVGMTLPVMTNAALITIIVFSPFIVTKLAHDRHGTNVKFGLYTHIFHFILFIPDIYYYI